MTLIDSIVYTISIEAAAVYTEVARGGSRIAATPKMEHFVIIVNNLQCCSSPRPVIFFTVLFTTLFSLFFISSRCIVQEKMENEIVESIKHIKNKNISRKKGYS